MTTIFSSALSAGELIYLATAKYVEEANLQMRRYLGDVDPGHSRVIGSDEDRIVSLQTSDGDVVAMYEVSDEGLVDLIP
ncbi:MAG: hypothetical protein J5I53_08995 [Bradyrhizobiaceae bacterium]|nr:hypothetical protein [Bradyrhizobiaceae bacterium]